MNNNNPNSDDQPVDSNRDLSWQAFCYVANELNATARRQFEIRLEQDQVARDAVVRAFNDARRLDLALSSTNEHSAEPTCELPNRTSQSAQLPQPVRSKSLRPTLLAIAAAGLLVMAFTQLPRAGTEVAQNTESPSRTVEFSKASMSLAETWADSGWEGHLPAEVVDIEDDLNCEHHSDCPLESPEDIDQDDWMTATLIDMAESSLQSVDKD